MNEERGWPEGVIFLIQAGADLSCTTQQKTMLRGENGKGVTSILTERLNPLSHALVKHDVSIASILLRHRPELMSADFVFDGKTWAPKSFCALHSERPVCQLVLRHLDGLQHCRLVVMLLLVSGKFDRGCVLRQLGRDMIILLAQCVWQTRYHSKWL